MHPLRNLLVLACVLVLTVVVTVASASAQTLTSSSNPVADAFVTTGPSNNLSGNNYGGAGALGVSGADSTKGSFEAVLRFDTTTAKADFDAFFGSGMWTVASAMLRLTTTNPNNAIFNAQVAGPIDVYWMLDDSWTEGTGSPMVPTTNGITYDSLPTYTAGEELITTLNYTATTSSTTVTYSLGTLPSAMVDDIINGGPISLHLGPGDDDVSYLFNSRSFGTAGARPLLILSAMAAVPEPTSGLLAAIAAGSMFGWGRMRRRLKGPAKAAENGSQA